MNKPEFRFRLNGVIIPEIRIQRADVDGEPRGALQIAVRDEWLGWLTVDDNSQLPGAALSQFILEFRNETEWQKKDAVEKRFDPQKGWHRVSPRKLMQMLQGAGVIDVEELRET